MKTFQSSFFALQIKVEFLFENFFEFPLFSFLRNAPITIFILLLLFDTDRDRVNGKKKFRHNRLIVESTFKKFPKVMISPFHWQKLEETAF